MIIASFRFSIYIIEKERCFHTRRFHFCKSHCLRKGWYFMGLVMCSLYLHWLGATPYILLAHILNFIMLPGVNKLYFSAPTIIGYFALWRYLAQIYRFERTSLQARKSMAWLYDDNTLRSHTSATHFIQRRGCILCLRIISVAFAADIDYWWCAICIYTPPARATHAVYRHAHLILQRASLPASACDRWHTRPPRSWP